MRVHPQVKDKDNEASSKEVARWRARDKSSEKEYDRLTKWKTVTTKAYDKDAKDVARTEAHVRLIESKIEVLGRSVQEVPPLSPSCPVLPILCVSLF